MSSIKQFSLFDADIRHLEFRKPSALTQISNKGNLNQRKVMNPFLIIAKDVLKRNPNADVFQVDLGVLKAMAGIKKQNNKKLRQDLKALTTMGFEYNILKKDEQDWGAFPFLSFININSKRGQTAKLSFSLAPPIKIALTNPKMWVKLRLFLQHNMTSKFGISLWETLSDYAKLDKITYPLEQFKWLMGVEPHQYKVITMFKKKVIDVALKEVNERTNITASYEFVKEGKKIVWITFYPSLKNKDSDEQSISKTIAQKLKYYGFKAVEIKKRLEKHDEDYLLANIAVVENYLEQGKAIENVKAYIKSAFKDDYRVQETPYSKQKKIAFAQKEQAHIEAKEAATKAKSLQEQFDKWKLDLARRRVEDLANDQYEALKSEFLQEIESNDFFSKWYQKDGFEHRLIQNHRKKYLAEKLLSDEEKDVSYFEATHWVEEWDNA